MATNGMEWQCVHVLPKNLRHIHGHVIGPSIFQRYLEVAVPSNSHPSHEHVKYDPPGFILTDLPVAAEAAERYGYGAARDRAFKDFLLRVTSGINKHGPCLADYYRRRYINYRSSIEYAMLLNDLRTATHTDTVVVMVIFLVLAFAKPHDSVIGEVMQMKTEQALHRLKTALTNEMRSVQPCEDALGFMGHVFVRAGGVPHFKVCKEVQGTYFPSIAYRLMSHHAAEELRDGIDITALLKNLSGCQALSQCHVQIAFVQAMAHKLGCIHWIPMAGMPDFLTFKNSSSQALTSFPIFVEELFNVSDTLELHDNAERLFAIWAYRERDVNDEPVEKLERHADYLFAKFGQSLIETQDPSQMVLDLMAMACIARLHTTSGSTGTYHGPILDLQQIIKTRRYQTATTLTYLLICLSKALEKCEEFGNASLINMTKLTFMSLIPASTPKRYWAYRIRKKKAHKKAFERTFKWAKNSHLATMRV